MDPSSCFQNDSVDKSEIVCADCGRATSFLRSFHNIFVSNHSNSVPSPSTSPSTSTLPNLATASDAEINRARIETMNKLIGILQRNLRVRYELDVAEVVHA